MEELGDRAKLHAGVPNPHRLAGSTPGAFPTHRIVSADRHSCPMTDTGPAQLPNRVFAVARGQLADAERIRAELNDLWNSIRSEKAFSAWIETPADQSREVWCSLDSDPDLHARANFLMGAFVVAVKAAMDSCVHAAATAVCSAVGHVDRQNHKMPLLEAEADFDALPLAGKLDGLRPDQIQTLRQLQPFQPQMNEPISRAMRHLAAGLDAAASGRLLFTAWVSKARPVPHLPHGVTVQRTIVHPAGTLNAPKCLVTFELDGLGREASFSGNPNVSFDPIMNVVPWPTDPNDNFSTRSRLLLVVTRHLIEGLERSVSAPFRIDLLEAIDRQLPAEPSPVWLPVHFNDAAEELDVRDAIDESDQQLATYLGEDGTLTYLRFAGDGSVLGREIAPASRILGESPDGTAVEEATRAAAGRWGLPDFVLRPKVLRKGSGVREVGDGTILTGSRGISLQVKSRSVATDSPEKAATWMLKSAAHGLRQARGTIRTALQDPSVQLTNLRGRDVAVRGRTIDWVPVVVIDHPRPARHVYPAHDSRGPSLVMLRRDWEFLWDQLRSASAIVDYVHRVASEEEPLELGAETHRYFDLAGLDAAARANDLPAWLSDSGVERPSLPLLPRDPAASPDRLGHSIFRQILEDIAESDFTGEEADRLDLLSYIDRVAVAARADLGRLLLRRLTECARALPDGHRMDHRIMFIDDGALQLSFTTMSQLTHRHQEIYRTWLLHRRQKFLTSSGAQGPIYPWTVGVLLTPRPGRGRPWDTTVISTNGPPTYDAEEFDRLEPLLAPNV